MKTLRAKYPALLNTGWSMLTANPPAAPAKELPPKAEQIVAKKPGAEPETESKIPF